MARKLPAGTVTFLFTDVEGSTMLLHELGAEGYAAALAQHRRLVREVFAAQGGVEVDTQGDALFYAFADARAGVRAAAAANQALAAGPVRIRMGLHTGSPLLTAEGYVGEDVHLGARIAAAGHGGQVLLSASTRASLDADVADLGEHRLKDFADAVAIFQLGDERFPPLKTISNTNLPRPASTFVGRERETAQVVELVRRQRLVTLSGPGGSGKTRLSIEAAAELVGEFKAGVFWVALAPIRDPSLVLDAVARTLGATDGLAEHIHDRELLLLLDNLEQVVEAAPELAGLVESCPNLHLLVTSRELLRVRGEAEYPVPPLAEPEAVTLFSERAGLEPDETISELCRRLDNLPLAVELAAARSSVLTPQQVLDRLSQRLDLLKGGRDAEARQQTLRATIEWSHELLADDEKQLFARLAVFSGGCTLDAAESVADADVDTLQSLVDKSLVRHTNDRFWMLETIREYATERLETPETGRRHADHFLALAEEAAPELLGADPSDPLERLDGEHDNLRAALDWLEAEDESETLLTLAGALSEFWGLRGHAHEGLRRLERALARSGPPTPSRARAIAGAANLAIWAGAPRRARPDAEAALDLYRRLGDDWGTAFALLLLGNVAEKEADLAANAGAADERERLYREGLRRAAEAAELFGRLGDEHLTLEALYEMSYAQIELGDTRRGKELREEILRRARAHGDLQAELLAVGGLVRFAFDDGRFEDALSLLATALRIAQRFGNQRRLAILLGRCALALAHLGRSAKATQILARSQAIYDETGMSLEAYMVPQVEETIELIRAGLDEASYHEAWRRGSQLTLDEAIELALAPGG